MLTLFKNGELSFQAANDDYDTSSSYYELRNVERTFEEET